MLAREQARLLESDAARTDIGPKDDVYDDVYYVWTCAGFPSAARVSVLCQGTDKVEIFFPLEQPPVQPLTASYPTARYA